MVNRLFQKTGGLLSFLGILSSLAFSGCVRLQNAHTKASNGMVDFVQKVDSFFGEERAREEYRKTSLIAGVGTIIDKDGNVKFSGRNQAKIPLPVLKARWGVLIGATSEHDDLSKDTIGDPDQGNYESFIRFFTKNNRLIHWDFDLGAKYSNGIDTFTRARAENDGFLGGNEYRIIQSFYWTNREGFGMKNRCELDERTSRNTLVREFTEMDYNEITNGVELAYGAYLRVIACEGFGWGLEITNLATTDPWKYDHIDFTARVRKSVFWQWLELEAAPRMRFYPSDNWTSKPSVEIILNLVFDAEHL
jgi:hypothetical protein